MKRMLINATQEEELRVAMVDGQKLYDLDIEIPSREQKKSNIYKSKITRIEPSLEAVFVDYGSERHGFLPFKEIVRHYFDPEVIDDKGRSSIKDALKIGQSLLIQVDKEERGNKGAALTTKISLAGRFLVLMPTDARAGGVSRRIEGDDRSEVREVLNSLNIPQGMGVIVRTAGVGRSTEELQWDLDYLTHLWSVIEKASEEREAPFLIYQESNVIIRALRDHYRNDIGEIIIDEEPVYQQAHNFIKQVMPHDLRKLKKYSESIPLFNRFQIESQIETAFQREVKLPSGGAIVIDNTEALTSIDINSARATKGSDIEETALHTNLEAVDEIARQLRLRDLGGLIVIDFIDMLSAKNQRTVEERLRTALKLDRARVQIGRISRFGLLEMSRQRLRPSLGESSQMPCPRCSGHGYIRSVESLALAVLRLVEEEAMKENTARVLAQVPIDVATFLLNEKRNVISDTESRNSVDVFILPNPNMETPHYSVERVRISEATELAEKNSYEQITESSNTPLVPDQKEPQKAEVPAVKNVVPPSPVPEAGNTGGFWKKLLGVLFGKRERKSSNKINQIKNNRQHNKRHNNKQRQRNQRNRKPKSAQGQNQKLNNETRNPGGNESNPLSNKKPLTGLSENNRETPPQTMQNNPARERGRHRRHRQQNDPHRNHSARADKNTHQKSAEIAPTLMDKRAHPHVNAVESQPTQSSGEQQTRTNPAEERSITHQQDSIAQKNTIEQRSPHSGSISHHRYPANSLQAGIDAETEERNKSKPAASPENNKPEQEPILPEKETNS